MARACEARRALVRLSGSNSDGACGCHSLAGHRRRRVLRIAVAAGMPIGHAHPAPPCVRARATCASSLPVVHCLSMAVAHCSSLSRCVSSADALDARSSSTRTRAPLASWSRAESAPSVSSRLPRARGARRSPRGARRGREARRAAGAPRGVRALSRELLGERCDGGVELLLKTRADACGLGALLLHELLRQLLRAADGGELGRERVARVAHGVGARAARVHLVTQEGKLGAQHTERLRVFIQVRLGKLPPPRRV